MIPTSDFVIDAAVQIVEALPRSKSKLADELGVSVNTIQRATEWLRTIGAPLTYDRRKQRWTLEPGWEIPADHLPCWAIRERMRSIVGPNADPFEVLRRAVEAGLHQPKKQEISTRDPE